MLCRDRFADQRVQVVLVEICKSFARFVQRHVEKPPFDSILDEFREIALLHAAFGNMSAQAVVQTVSFAQSGQGVPDAKHAQGWLPRNRGMGRHPRQPLMSWLDVQASGSPIAQFREKHDPVVNRRSISVSNLETFASAEVPFLAFPPIPPTAKRAYF